MPKPDKGRFDGVYGMKMFGAAELFEMALTYEASISAPDNTDDPKWLQRVADRIRRLAVGKQKALERKERNEAQMDIRARRIRSRNSGTNGEDCT